MAKKKKEPNHPGLLDNITMISANVGAFVVDNPLLQKKENKELRKKAKQACKLLGEVHQGVFEL